MSNPRNFLPAVKIGILKHFSPSMGQLFRHSSRLTSAMASETLPQHSVQSSAPAPQKEKLFGRKFYESIGSPKYVVAPMVDRSEFVS
jgi:hypothetical protein